MEPKDTWDATVSLENLAKVQGTVNEAAAQISVKDTPFRAAQEVAIPLVE